MFAKSCMWAHLTQDTRGHQGAGEELAAPAAD